MFLFKLIRRGKVNLYLRTVAITSNAVSSNHLEMSQVTDAKEYYIMRKNEPFATRVLQQSDGLSIAKKVNQRSFENYLKKYFSDCPDVVSYIDANLYENFNIGLVVEDYNLLCE